MHIGRLVDLFTPPYPHPSTESVKSRLLTYYALLQESRLTHSTLSQLPLPLALDPRRPTALPSRIFTLALLVRDTLASLIRLPFFLFPLLVHLPVYALGKYIQDKIVDEEEVAQGKVFLGLFLLVGTYSVMFMALWTFMWLSPLGAVVAMLVTWAFAVYHVQLVDQNYDRCVPSPLPSQLFLITDMNAKHETSPRSLARPDRRLGTAELGRGAQLPPAIGEA